MRWKRELGEQIKRGRESARITQKQLSSLLRVSRQMISRYETGQDIPAVQLLARLAQILETDFHVQGFRIAFEETAASPKPRPVPKQLRLEFEKSRRFKGAVVEITPRKDRILIRAEIPA